MVNPSCAVDYWRIDDESRTTFVSFQYLIIWKIPKREFEIKSLHAWNSKRKKESSFQVFHSLSNSKSFRRFQEQHEQHDHEDYAHERNKKSNIGKFILNKVFRWALRLRWTLRQENRGRLDNFIAPVRLL